MPALTAVDVCIVGGGPAGSVAARLLASWGWSVVLLHRRPTAPPLAESLPPSTRKLLSLVGIAAEVDAASFFPNTGNTSWWAGEDRRTDSPAGFHVSRGAWDALLLDAAAKAGARIVEAAVRHVDLPTRRIVATGRNGELHRIEARHVLDCSGRAGVVARHGFRRRAAAYRTLAITAEWHTPDWPGDEQTRTVAESHAAGWSWSVPLSRTTRQCTVMIDPVARASDAGGTLQDIYARELARAVSIHRRLRSARQLGAAWACDASVYDSGRTVNGDAILVGDAASSIEPLSSAGVKKAMLSAWRAAVVVNTSLRDAGRRAVAQEYHESRERQVFRSCAREAARFFAEAAAAHGGRFWEARRSWSAAVPEDDGADTVGAPTLGGGDVLAAFDRLRDGSAPLRVSPSLEVEAAPTIEGDEVVLRDALRLPGFAGPVRFASNVNLPALVAIVARHDDVASALRAYCLEVNRVAPADLLRGLSLLVARRAILHEGARV